MRDSWSCSIRDALSQFPEPRDDILCVRKKKERKEGRKEGKKEERKEERKKGRKEGRKEGKKEEKNSSGFSYLPQVLDWLKTQESINKSTLPNKQTKKQTDRQTDRLLQSNNSSDELKKNYV